MRNNTTQSGVQESRPLYKIDVTITKYDDSKYCELLESLYDINPQWVYGPKGDNKRNNIYLSGKGVLPAPTFEEFAEKAKRTIIDTNKNPCHIRLNFTKIDAPASTTFIYEENAESGMRINALADNSSAAKPESNTKVHDKCPDCGGPLVVRRKEYIEYPDVEIEKLDTEDVCVSWSEKKPTHIDSETLLFACATCQKSWDCAEDVVKDHDNKIKQTKGDDNA